MHNHYKNIKLDSHELYTHTHATHTHTHRLLLQRTMSLTLTEYLVQRAVRSMSLRRSHSSFSLSLMATMSASSHMDRYGISCVYYKFSG